MGACKGRSREGENVGEEGKDGSNKDADKGM